MPEKAACDHGGAGSLALLHPGLRGGPRSYKWLNTVPIPKVWEQMHLAYRYGATRLWIVNVGDIKPMEFPIQFFLDYAWAPERWPVERLGEFTRAWAAREFGPDHAAEIADVVAKYTKYNGRRKPEMLEPGTYSLVNYREADTVVADYRELTRRAEALYSGAAARREGRLLPARALPGEGVRRAQRPHRRRIPEEVPRQPVSTFDDRRSRPLGHGQSAATRITRRPAMRGVVLHGAMCDSETARARESSSPIKALLLL